MYKQTIPLNEYLRRYIQVIYEIKEEPAEAMKMLFRVKLQHQMKLEKF